MIWLLRILNGNTERGKESGSDLWVRHEVTLLYSSCSGTYPSCWRRDTSSSTTSILRKTDASSTKDETMFSYINHFWLSFTRGHMMDRFGISCPHPNWTRVKESWFLAFFLKRNSKHRRGFRSCAVILTMANAHYRIQKATNVFLGSD